ncbi:calcium-binding protein, partial [Lutimaribacter marinistellae]
MTFVISTTVTAPETLTSGQYGFIAPSGSLVVSTADAVSASGTVDVTVLGAISATGSDNRAIEHGGTGLRVEIGADGHISSADSEAISTIAYNFVSVVNAGHIFSYSSALDLNPFTTSVSITVKNSGVIDAGGSAIDADSGAASMRIENTGLISGASTAIYNAHAGQTGGTTLINDGEIIARDISFFGSLGNDFVRNSGLMSGNVILSDGDDTYDGREGSVTGVVAGNGGNDLYIVDDATIELLEQAPDGNDTVESSVSFKLQDHIEELTLLEGGDINGEGNDLSNRIRGNMGANRIDGGGETDYIFGRGGSDTILGGDGDDYLSTNSGWDRVYGEAGNDTLLGGAGRDVLDGGEGQDRASYYNAQLTGVFASLQNPANNTG